MDASFAEGAVASNRDEILAVAMGVVMAVVVVVATVVVVSSIDCCAVAGIVMEHSGVGSPNRLSSSSSSWGGDAFFGTFGNDRFPFFFSCFGFVFLWWASAAEREEEEGGRQVSFLSREVHEGKRERSVADKTERWWVGDDAAVGTTNHGNRRVVCASSFVGSTFSFSVPSCRVEMGRMGFWGQEEGKK